MEQAVGQKKNSYPVKIAIALTIYIAFKFVIPPIGLITKVGMDVLGVFAVTIYLWMSIGIGWPSFLAIGLIALSGIYPSAEVIRLSWGDWMTPFMVSCLLLNYAMKETGFSQRFALWFITRKFLKGRPWLFTIMFLFSCMVVGCFMTASPVTVLFITLAEQIFENTGLTKKDRYTQMVVASIGWVATATMAMTPISHVLVIMIIGYIAKDFGVHIGVLNYSIVGIVTGLLFFACLVLICRFIIKPDVSKLKNLDIEKIKEKVPPVSRQERIVGAVFGLLVLVWVAPELLKLFAFAAPLIPYVRGMGAAIPAVIAVSVLCILQVKGKPVLDFVVGCSNIAWSSVIMVASLMLMGGAISSKEAGISDFLSSIMKPLTASLPPKLFVAVVLLWVVVQTSFMSNTVCALLYTVITPIALTIPGVNAIALGMMVGAIANYGLATPAATTSTSIAVGSGWVNGSFLFRYGWYLVFAVWLIFIFVGYPLASVLF